MRCQGPLLLVSVLLLRMNQGWTRSGTFKTDTKQIILEAAERERKSFADRPREAPKKNSLQRTQLENETFANTELNTDDGDEYYYYYDDNTSSDEYYEDNTDGGDYYYYYDDVENHASDNENEYYYYDDHEQYN